MTNHSGFYCSNRWRRWPWFQPELWNMCKSSALNSSPINLHQHTNVRFLAAKYVIPAAQPTVSERALKGVCIYSHLICYRNIQILLRPTITTTIFCFCLTCLFRGHDARSDWVPEGLPIMNQWTLLVWGFTHQLPMLSPNKQCQNKERTIQTYDQFNS